MNHYVLSNYSKYVVYKNSTSSNSKTRYLNMESTNSSSSISLLSLPCNSTSDLHFNTLFSNLNTTLIFSKTRKSTNNVPLPHFLCTSMSMQLKLQPPTPKKPPPTSHITLKSSMNNLSVFERAFIGTLAGASAGAFTYFCLHPLDTIKTKLQTKGASQIYKNTLDAIIKTFQTKGISGFYSGISAVIVGSTFSSALLFGTCEFSKSCLSKFDEFPSLLVPPTASLMGSIVSSAVMVPKELITQRMQAGAKGKSWEILAQILRKGGILGLYTGYSATLLRNLPAGVLSYSSFEWLKIAVLKKGNKEKLTPLESVCCGALAGAISASLTTPLDVVKTRMMTQFQGVVVNDGVSGIIKQILMEEGWVGLTRGMGARVVHSACFSAIGYFAFETARLAILDQYLKHKNQSKEIMALEPSLNG
ncbi:protein MITOFERRINLIKE 1, chloroplastic-like [Chenopodium quinoa]|nr:protein MITOFERRINLIKE 1, chloroplastic-like [Chenopodium quinoa]